MRRVGGWYRTVAAALALGAAAGGCGPADREPGGGAAAIRRASATGPARVTSRALRLLPALTAAGRATGLGVAGVALPLPAPPEPPVPPDPAPVAGEVVIAPPPVAFEAPAERPAAPPPVLQEPARVQGVVPSGGTWAVIVGVNDYPGSRSDLRSAVNDANDVDLALAGLGVPLDHRLVLRNTQATSDVIRAATDWLVARAGPDAVAVFFYSGHVRKLGPTTEALVGADGGLLRDDELGARLSHLQARRAWVAIAACFGGGFTEVLAPGRILTGAAPADALAYESSRLGRSYMVQYMIREAMIEGRASGSVQAAFTYATLALARQNPTRLPVQIDLSVLPLDLRPPGESKAPLPPLVPPGPRQVVAVPAPPPPPAPSPPQSCLLLLLCSTPSG